MVYHMGLPVTSKEAETLETAYGQIKYKKHVTRKLYHKGLPVTSKEAETLQRAYGQIKYTKHVTRKEKWKPLTYATIWWEVHSLALANLKTTTGRVSQN
jgi:hypothetical protein